jgi:hypothetical protein
LAPPPQPANTYLTSLCNSSPYVGKLCVLFYPNFIFVNSNVFYLKIREKLTMRSAALIKEELSDNLMILSIYRSFSSRGRERLLHIQDMGRGPNSVFWVNHNSRHLARGPSLYIRQSSVLPSFFAYVGH